MSFLKDAVHLVRCSLTQSVSSSVALGVNLSLGVVRVLLQSVHKSELKPESLPKPRTLCTGTLLSRFCDVPSDVVDDMDEHSSMYEIARSPNGTLTEEHSLLVVDVEHDGRKNSDRLSVSSLEEGDALILLRRS